MNVRKAAEHSPTEAAFRAGVAEGLDPQPDDDVATEGRSAVTHVSSPWYGEVCTTCAHTFRRGDEVARQAQTGDMQHLDPALRCATSADAAPQGGADTAEFTEGLRQAWPPRNGIPITTLASDARQVARHGDRRPPLCQACGHTFRAGESVVLCPCYPYDPGPCVSAMHRDPGAGMPCWEQAEPTGVVEVCPWQLTRVTR
jgi:hypothetical protein